jgi:hypothetical protein
MAIGRHEAENIIIEANSQFVLTLQRLNTIIPNDGQLNYEQRTVKELYRNICNIYEITTVNSNIRNIVSRILSSDLQEANNSEIIEALMECRELSRLYQLPIYNEIPKGEIIISSRVQENELNFRIISNVAVNSFSNDKSIEVGTSVIYTVEKTNRGLLLNENDFTVIWSVINDTNFNDNNKTNLINNVALELVNVIDNNKWNRRFVARQPGYHIIVAEVYNRNKSGDTLFERVEYTQRVNYFKWNSINLINWKIIPEQFGGGIPYIQRFKDGWVNYNRAIIIERAHNFQFPPELLAGVCWIEVAGDPNIIDRIAFEVRAFDWSGPDLVDENLTITKSPQNTSFGSVSIQLRTAAQTMKLDVLQLTTAQYRELSEALQNDVFNISIVAQHIRDLIDHDRLQENPPLLDMDSIRIVGARYNRGMGLPIERILENTSYGNFIVNNWERFRSLLE